MCGKWLTKAAATTQGGSVGPKCAREAGLLGPARLPLFSRSASPARKARPVKPDAMQMALELL
jgi:hypothetical protein